MSEFKNYIENRNSYLTIEEYIYITGFIEFIHCIKYNFDQNCFEVWAHDNNYFKIYIKESNKVKKKN